VQEIESILPEVRALRHELHRHPELAYAEHETARRVLEFMGDLAGAEIQTGIGGTGIIVVFGKALKGPCVALRADMDALPMHEESGADWSSRIPGKMHACGHDGHTAMLAGAARLIARHVDALEGPVKLIFQPAEEGGAGGRVLCEAGALNNPDVAAIYGLHNNLPDPAMKIGTIAYSSGPAMAGTGTFDIEVIGVGGHAAFPQRCVDPVYIGSCIVDQLQGIVSRRVDPLASAVISVTRFDAGSAYNIIAGSALLRGTFRALDADVLKLLQEGIIKRATEVARAHGAEVRIRCELGYPVLVNNHQAEQTFRDILEEIGFSGRLKRVLPNMGGEDFAYYLQKVPGFFYFLPACPADRDAVAGCHHPAFDFNDDLLADGMRLHLETALRFARVWKG
jgi:amidohydrolase